jgi:hypothetical protein
MENDAPISKLESLKTEAIELQNKQSLQFIDQSANRESLIQDSLKLRNEQNKDYIGHSQAHHSYLKPVQLVGTILVVVEGAIGIYLAGKAAFGNAQSLTERMELDVILSLGLLLLAAGTIWVLKSCAPRNSSGPPSGIGDKTPPPSGIGDKTPPEQKPRGPGN